MVWKHTLNWYNIEGNHELYGGLPNRRGLMASIVMGPMVSIVRGQMVSLGKGL